MPPLMLTTDTTDTEDTMVDTVDTTDTLMVDTVITADGGNLFYTMSRLLKWK